MAHSFHSDYPVQRLQQLSSAIVHAVAGIQYDSDSNLLSFHPSWTLSDGQEVSISGIR